MLRFESSGRRHATGGTAERDVERLLREGVDPSDARLLHRFHHDRGESAFEALVDRHGPLVLSLCRRYLRNPRDVEDAFQATFLVLVRKGSGLRDCDALASWLYGVARRTALRARSNILTRRDREGASSQALDEARAESSPPVDDALETLDEENRGGLDQGSDGIADSPLRPRTIRPVRLASDICGDLTSKAFGAGDLREIEAELLYAYPVHRDILDGVQEVMARTKQAAVFSRSKVDKEVIEKEASVDPSVRAGISHSKEKLEEVVKPVRLILARLLEMKDNRSDMEQAIKDRTELLEGLSREAMKKDLEYRAVREETAKNPAERQRSEFHLNRLTDEIDRGREAIAALKHDLTRLQLAIKPLDRRAADVDRLIQWTRQHFKEAPLTIDDAPTDAKSD